MSPKNVFAGSHVFQWFPLISVRPIVFYIYSRLYFIEISTFLGK